MRLILETLRYIKVGSQLWTWPGRRVDATWAKSDLIILLESKLEQKLFSQNLDYELITFFVKLSHFINVLLLEIEFFPVLDRKNRFIPVYPILDGKNRFWTEKPNPDRRWVNDIAWIFKFVFNNLAKSAPQKSNEALVMLNLRNSKNSCTFIRNVFLSVRETITHPYKCTHQV